MHSVLIFRDRGGLISVKFTYRKTSNKRPTKPQNLNVSRVVLQLSLANLSKPGVKSRMKM